MADGDDRILSYHDAILVRSDLTDLLTTSFLSDRVIHFFFTHLSVTNPNPNSIAFIPPSVSFLLSNLPIPLPELDLPSKTLILLPVNNNPDVTSPEGGSHWSLLVYYRPNNLFVHHDSMEGANSRHARALHRAVRGMVGADGGGDAGFVEGYTPQQRNWYDCGVYVMAVAKTVCEWIPGGGGGDEKEEEEEEMWIGEVRRKVDEESVTRLRKEVFELVTSLMKSP